VHLDELARVWKAGGSFAQFLNSLPRILVGTIFAPSSTRPLPPSATSGPSW